jgi:hypothetical protein
LRYAGLRESRHVGAGAAGHLSTHIRASVDDDLLKGELPMRLTKNIGMLLLAVWLILTGLIPLINLSVSGLSTGMAVLAVVAGILILVGR